MTNTRPTLTPLGAAYEAHPEWTYSTIERAVYDRLRNQVGGLREAMAGRSYLLTQPRGTSRSG